MKKVCGLDVHKDSIFCAIYNGEEYSEVKEYTTMTGSIYSMGEYLQSEGVNEIAMESRGIYRIAVWDLLLETGFELTFVNPFLIKQMPGRKSDVKDAQWIATLLHKGMIRGSYVPVPLIQELRVYSRKYGKLQQQVTRVLTGLAMKLLQTLPGISRIAAGTIIAETGGDMSVFENSSKIAGWAGLRPGNDESAGKYKSTATGKGNKYLRSILVQVSLAASGMKGSYFKEKFNRLALRKSRKKALIAIARKLLVVIWNVPKYQKEYNPLSVPVYDPVKMKARLAYHKKEYEKAANILSIKI